MKFTPLEHQVLAIDHLIKNDEALLYAGMGLGKTAAVLSAADWHFANGSMKGLLVIAPLRVSVLSWPDELAKWDCFQYMKISNLRTKEGLADWQQGKSHIYTINYEAMPKFVKEYIKGKRAHQLPVCSVVFDEIDNCKNPSSKRIKTFRQFARPKFLKAWGLTGTPIANSRLDLFAQVRLIDEGKTFGIKYGQWERQFFEPENHHSAYPKMVPRQGTAEALEKHIAHMALVLLSKDWLKILKPETKDIMVTLPVDAKKIYKKVEKELLETLADGSEIIAVNAAVLVTKLLQITSGAVYVQEGEDESTRRPETIHTAKIDTLEKLHVSIGRKPLIVACQYKHEVTRILEKFRYAKKFTNDCLKDWNAGKIKMLVSHPKSIGHGLNLQDGGHHVCWFTLGYSRALYDQLNARLARQGQAERVIIHRLLVSGTVDDAVVSALDNKEEDQRAFLETLNNIKRLAAK